MSASGRRLHLLVDSDPQLAASLWFGCTDEDKPFLICANPLASSIGNPHIPEGDPYRIGLSLDRLINCTVHGGNDPEFEIELGAQLANVRRHFGLAMHDKIRLALAGSHSSISGSFDGASTNRGVNVSRPKRSGIEDGMRKGRTLAGLVDAAFAKLNDFEPVWLTDAFPELRPAPSPGRYVGLARIARAKLATLDIPPYRGTGLKLRRPAVPLIYVTADDSRDDDAAWVELAPVQRDHPYSVTQKLIAQFEVRHRDNPRLRGVLVKLLPDDVGDQNVLDAPMVGESTINSADQAGIEAILLDARYGVVRRPFSGPVKNELVFGSPVSVETAFP